MDKPPPICACCGEKIAGLWMVTRPPMVYVICGKGTCEGWARSQGLGIHTIGTAASTKMLRRPSARRRPGCDRCGAPLEHAFRWDGHKFCTLTCQNEYRVDSNT